MALVAEATSTLARLTKLRAVAEGADEAKALELLRSELAEMADSVHAFAVSRTLFGAQAVSLSALADLTATQEALRKVFDRFQEAPESKTLRQGTRWTGLAKRLETFTEKAREAQNADWLRYFDEHFFGGLPPSKREATLAKTPQNELALKRYRELYQLFIRFRLKPPATTEEFQLLRNLSQQLGEIEFKEDVPDEVRKFLEALSAGAGLHLLTAEVLGWLKDNDLLGNYVVRAQAPKGFP